jgi:hypothetical protein
MATDFRDGKTFPRPGRLKIGPYMWLARIADKGRAAAAGTIFDYIYPCTLDQGVLQRWGVTPAEFDAALAQLPVDDALHAWLAARTDASHAEAANAWLTNEKSENLDRQDREEGA